MHERAARSLMSHSRVSNLSAGRIALGYAVIAILWIAFSNAVVVYLKLPPAVKTIKGTVFVFVTASLLYFTIRRLVQAVQRTSQERDETADLYRTLVQASNEGVCLLDESGRMSFLNGRLATILGRSAEELQGQRLQDFLEEPQVLALPGAQQSETRECRLRKDSDPKPWVLLSRHPVLNDAGEVVRLVVTVIDITERKQADKALRRSDAYLAAVPGAQENLGESQLASPVRYGLAILSVGAALAVALLLQHFHFRDAAIPLLLFAVAISSWYGGAGPAVLSAILSTIGFYWYFVEPVQTIYIYWSNVPYFIIFVAFTLLISWFATIRRRVEAGLHEQAALLNLTHDTVFVMDMEGMIRYWNRGAEERYGWPAEKAVGRVVHDLLKTVFPRPLEEIKAELIQTGRWEGELVHTKKDGTQVAVASRWSLQRDRHGAPFAILETNNDISERKRAEEALSRLNRELRAISNCNQVLLRATDEQSLLKEICRIVCEEAGYRMAWVGYAEHDEAKSVRPVAWSGAEEGYLASLGITWADTERGRGPTGTAIRSGKTCCIQDFATDPRLAPWRESALQHGFLSGIALPLKDEHGNAFGSLSIYSAQPNAFSSEEIRLLEELAGDLAFGIVTLRSRAARKRAEEEVRNAAAQWQATFDAVRDLVLLLDKDFRILRVNVAAAEFLGLPVDKIVGGHCYDLIHGTSTPPAECPLAKMRQSRRHEEMEVLARNGGPWLSVSVYPVFDASGQLQQVVHVARDITDRKRAGEALRLSNAYNRSLIEASLDPLVTIGPDGEITDVNAATESATGHSRSELVGTDFCDYFTEPARARAGYEQAFREGTVRDYPLELRHREGHIMSVLYNASVYRDQSGRVIGVFAAAHDITERLAKEAAGGGQPGQGRVPGQRQPRDPHAHERHPRHDRAGPRHRADRRPAAVPDDGQVRGRQPAGHHQRPARFLQDRGRQAGAGPGRFLSACGRRRHRAGPGRACPQEGAGADLLRAARRARRPGRRRRPAAAGAAQPGRQRHQVHRRGRGGCARGSQRGSRRPPGI